MKQAQEIRNDQIENDDQSMDRAVKEERFRGPVWFRILFWCLQWTWGIVQNIVAGIIFLVHIKKPHRMYRNCIMTYWKNHSSMSMGMFLFIEEAISEEAQKGYEPEYAKFIKGSRERILYHEFGHSIQSIILGPFYLLAISAPSGIWCMIPYFQKLREKKNISYYWFYPERWADFLGMNCWADKRK